MKDRFKKLLLKNDAYKKSHEKKHLYRILSDKFSFLANSQTKKYSVALILRDGDHFPKSSAFIRLISPLTTSPVAEGVSLDIFSAQKLPKKIKSEFVIVQRTAFDSLNEAEKMVNKLLPSAKLIIDNDDAFHLIDKTHPEYNEQVKRVKAIEYLFGKADQIWVSTENLVNDKYKHKTKVVINTLDKRLWDKAMTFSKSNSPIQMIYMGTATHDADFAMIFPVLDKLASKSQGSFALTIIGVSRNIPEREWITRLSPPYLGSLYPVFVEWFLKQGPFDIGLSPLVNNDFNRAKSDIKCLDYLAAGILPVVSDIEPYQSNEIKDFVIKIKNNDSSWFSVLSKIVEDKAGFRKEKNKIIKMAKKYIWQKRSAEITGQLLLKNLQDLK